MFQKNKSLTIFLVGAFVFNLVFSIYYFEDQASKEATYIKELAASGYEYIVPEGHEYLFGDADAYNKLAYSLIKNGDFYNPIGQISAWVTPGYPLFLSFVYSVFGLKYFPVLLLQNLLLILIYLNIYRVTLIATNSLPTAFIALILVFINLRVTTFVQEIYTEILFFFFVTSSLLLLLSSILEKSEKKYDILHKVFLGIILGYTILIRPTAIPYVAICFGFMVFRREKFWSYSLVLVFCIATFSPWILRNYYQFGRIIISTNSEITMGAPYLNLDKFSFSEVYDLHEFTNNHTRVIIDKEELAAELLKKRVNSQTKEFDSIKQGYKYEHVGYLFGRNSANWALENPGKYFIRTLYLSKSILSPYTNDMSRRNKIMASLLWLLTILPAFIQFFMDYKNPITWFLFLSGVSLLVLPSLTLIDFNLRYQLPAQIIFTILSAKLWYRVYGKLR